MDLRLQETETYVRDGVFALAKHYTDINKWRKESCSQLTLEELLPGAGLRFWGPILALNNGRYLSSDVILLYKIREL